MRIKGENAVDMRQSVSLAPTLKEISDLLNSETALADVEVHILYAQPEVDAISDAPKALSQLGCNTWQILRLEPLLDRACTSAGVTPTQAFDDDDSWLQKALFPLLVSTFSYQNKAVEAEQARAKQAHEETMDTLRADIAYLHHEKAKLQTLVQALQVPDMERLLVFLPAIFRNFWGVVRPDELALMAGTLKVPVIESPYPDPSAATVATLKRQLQKLPETDRAQVTGFCRALQHRLEVRPEMREFVPESA